MVAGIVLPKHFPGVRKRPNFGLLRLLNNILYLSLLPYSLVDDKLGGGLKVLTFEWDIGGV